MQAMVNLLRPNYSSISFVASSKSIAKGNPLFPKNYPKHLKLRNINYSSCSSSVATMTNCAAAQQYGVVVSQGDGHNNNKVDDSKKEDAKVMGGVRQGDQSSMIIPKHVAAILDGSRRWLQLHGLDLDYRPFFNANIRLADSCLKWGVTTVTAYFYGLGNFKHRTQEATDFFMGQFERFLEERLEHFMRNGVKVSVMGETSMLSKSCQATIEKVEEATKNNKNLELIIAVCYTSQRDIVEATKKICKKVKEGTMEIEAVNEDLIEEQLSLCGSRPPIDLCIRMGGQLRVGGLLGWQVPHVELYFTDAYGPDFGEHVLVDSLKSFQQRARWFGK